MEADPAHDLLVHLSFAFGAGIVLVALSRRFRFPVIVSLLVGGIVLGPEGFGFIQPGALGDALKPLASLAVGVILFEGGLTLDLHGFAHVSGVIKRLLTFGVLITWLGTAAVLWTVFDLDVRFALLAASLVIVTGPTVIVPLLRRINVVPRIHAILHWEGVLIDAIGVFVAILCFEWLAAGEGPTALIAFALRITAGLAVGFLGGVGIDALIRFGIVPDNLVNAFALGAAVFVFGLTEALIPEAGLLAVTVAGLVIGWRHPVELRRIREFKAEVTDLLIGTLFVLLAARLEIERFIDFGWRGVLVIALIMFLIRPLNVLASAVGSPLTWRERAFLSWIAPRGIVAASMASIFALDLGRPGSLYDAAFLETFVYSVIAATVIIQGFSANAFAGLLGVRQPKPEGWLIVGADRLARAVARFIQDIGEREVTVVDSSPRLINLAQSEQLESVRADALDVTPIDRDERFGRVGYLLTMTDNAELNELVCRRWSEWVPKHQLYRWGPLATEQQVTVGSAIWDKLPRPGLISAEMRRGEARVETISLPQAPDSDDVVLFSFINGEIQPGLKSETETAGQLLVLVREGDALLRGLSHGAVIDLEPGSFEEVQQQLARAAVDCEPVIRVELLQADIAERQRAMPAFLGHGIAAPHAFVRGLNRRIVILGRLPDGVVVPQQDEPVTLVFLIVSPSGDPEGHLATLADVAHLCASPSNRESLLTALGREEVLTVVSSVLE